jgi:hypothetical protein
MTSAKKLAHLVNSREDKSRNVLPAENRSAHRLIPPFRFMNRVNGSDVTTLSRYFMARCVRRQHATVQIEATGKEVLVHPRAYATVLM